MCDKQNDVFKKIFKEVEVMCVDHEITVRIPRRAGKQIHRCNVSTETRDDYYRVSICIPLFDSVLGEINERFCKHNSILSCSNVYYNNNKNRFTMKILSKRQKFYSKVRTDFKRRARRWR